MARALVLRAGAGSPACRDPRGGRQWGDAGACGVQVRLRPPSGRHGPFWGRGDAPSDAGGVEGRRPRGPQAGGEWGGEGGGGRAVVPVSSALGGGPWPPALSPSLFGAPRQGIHGSPGGRGRRARSGRPPVGQCGGGGGRFLAMACCPTFPRRASRRTASSPGATVMLRPTAPAQSRRPAAGYAGPARVTVPCLPPRAQRLGRWGAAVTTVVTCAGAGAAAVAGSAGCSAFWVRALRKARGSQLLASASVMRSTAPSSRKAGHVGALSGHAARNIVRRILSWSSGAAHPPGGTSRFPPSLRRSTASKGRFLIPLVGPELAQLNRSFGLGRGFVDEVGVEGGVGE